ncbi:hypothetical protein LY76DRAFT_670987 [Colletotrichum caudatum]|nr:hypothetical protein LY76DRAFT_670987 [Colletotrichum caudatum]
MRWIKEIINFAAVRTDAEDESTQFTTCLHAENDAPDKKKTSKAPYSYGRWLYLILESQNLSPDLLQKVALTHSQARLLYNACKASIQNNRANLVVAEGLDEEIAPAFSALQFPPEGLFAHLNACSPKDGAQAVPGKVSLRSAAEIILHLVTSGRWRTAPADCLNALIPVGVFFLPFDKHMSSERKFLLLYRPEDCRITGISQYSWHKRWRHAYSKGKDKTGRLLIGQGISFDLLYDEQSHGVELVELNLFEIRNPCGPCLFQWIRDGEVL